MTRLAAVPGLVVATVLAVAATALGTLLPVLGGPVAGLLLGVGVAAVLTRKAPAGGIQHLTPGLTIAGKPVLQLGIIVLGFGLSLADVATVGLASLPVLLGTLAVALGGSWALGRLLRLHTDTSLLIGAGTGICGASAIAAVTSVLRPAPERVAYSMGTIFTFNIVAVVVYPVLGQLLGLSDHGFGLWAGTAINDTSSVVAAAYAFSDAAGDHAVVVKLVRSLAIVPVCLALAFWRARRRIVAPGDSGTDPADPAGSVLRTFPWFILGFLAASAIATTGLIPGAVRDALGSLSSFLITVALVGVGMTLDLGAIRRAGARPLVLGGILGVAVGASALGLQAFTGQL